jgi:hypothetical protein
LTNLNLGDTRLLINACKRHGLLRNQCAYLLATSYHETAHSMRPIREMGGETYLRKKSYYPFVGMGYVQLTWKANYAKASAKLGVDFVKNPKLLLKPEYASEILVVGSLQGWFTTRKLSDYITLYKSDFVGARRIINGTDKAVLIAGYAEKYDAALKAEGYGEEPFKPAQQKPEDFDNAIRETMADIAASKPETSPKGFLAFLLDIFKSFVRGGK